MTTTRGRQTVQSNQKWDDLKFRLVVSGMMKGEDNRAGEVTLADGVTSTTVIDLQVHVNTRPILQANTATAAAATGVYIPLATILEGSFVIQHDSTADVDRTFTYLLGG